eukprot:gene4032-4408_t
MRLIVSFLTRLFLTFLTLVAHQKAGKAGFLVAAALATVKVYLDPTELVSSVVLLIALVLSQSAGYDFIALVVLAVLACSIVDDQENLQDQNTSKTLASEIQSPLPLDKKSEQASVSSTSSKPVEEESSSTTPEKRFPADNSSSSEQFATPVSSSSSAVKSKGTKKKSSSGKKESEAENPLQKAKEEARRALQQRVQDTQSRLTGGQH